MTHTGQCPHCFTTNSLNATHCLDCKGALPWAAAVIEKQRQLDAAKAAADAAAQQQQAQQANQAQARQNIVQAQATRAQNSGNTAPTAPGQALHINVYHVFADAFVGRFSETFENMDKPGAAWFGLICAVISNLCIAFGLHLIFRNLSGLFQGLMPSPMAPSDPLTPRTPDINDIPGAREIISLWKLFVVAFTPWLAIALSCTLARKLFGGEERHLEGDVFVAGVTLLPFSFVVLLTGFLSNGNWEVSATLSLFALTYTILLLYRGLTTVSGIRDMAVAFCVTPVIILSGYLAKIVFTRLLTL